VSIIYIIKFILTGIILIALFIALKVRKNLTNNEETYSEDVLEKATKYRESGKVEEYKKQLEDEELKAFLNSGYEDDDF
jgi:hypothetical protein